MKILDYILSIPDGKWYIFVANDGISFCVNDKNYYWYNRSSNSLIVHYINSFFSLFYFVYTFANWKRIESTRLSSVPNLYMKKIRRNIKPNNGCQQKAKYFLLMAMLYRRLDQKMKNNLKWNVQKKEKANLSNLKLIRLRTAYCLLYGTTVQ